MARVKVDLPERFAFATEIDVRVTDLNYGRHLGNDALVSLLHEARFRFLASRGLTEGDVGGASIIQADAAIVYKAEAFAGDRLRFEVAVGELGRASCDFFYRVTRPADAKLVAEAKTGMVFLDPATRKITNRPAVVDALAAG